MATITDRFIAFCLRVKGAFWPAVALLGAVAAMIGEWAPVLLGDGALTPFLKENLSRIGITLFLAAGVAVILKMEWRFKQVDEYFGNEHKKRLLLDGIAPVPDEYLRYVFAGDYAIAKRFWQAGIIDTKDHAGRRDLHTACEHGHAAIVQHIVDYGADPRGVDGNGITPLMAAAISGNVQVIDILLRHNCELNGKSSKGGCTALYIAAAYGHLEAIRTLIRHGAEIDCVDHSNLTPLMCAIARKKWEAADLLLESGADATRVDSAGASLLDYAKAFTAPDRLVSKLTQRGAPPANPKFKHTGGGFSRVGHLRVKWGN